MEDNVKTSALSQGDMLEKFVDQLIDEKKMPKTDELIEEIINESGVDTKQIAEKTLLNFREQFLA